MCLYAFLYFTEFSTVNINYFCNQKNTHTHTHTVIGRKKNTLPIQFLQGLYPSYRKISSQYPSNGKRGGCRPLVPVRCWSQQPENYRSPISINQWWRPDKGMTLDEHCPSVGMAQQAACLPQMA
jgi:hypothetical protein